MKNIIIFMAAIGLISLASVNAKVDDARAFKASWAQQVRIDKGDGRRVADGPAVDKGDGRRVRDWLVQFFFGGK